MKKYTPVTACSYCAVLLFTILFFAACKSNHEYLTPIQTADVKDSVTLLTTNVARDIKQKGPAAWLNYFDDSPQFFMADEGQLAFKNYSSAKSFILNTLVKSIKKIDLHWKNRRIDVLTTNIASIGADFHEDITFANGQTLPSDGYLTATAVFNGTTWKFRDLHWSIQKANNASK